MPRPVKYLLVILGFLLVMCMIASIPPIRTRLGSFFTRIQYALFPPQESLFLPQSSVATTVIETLQSARDLPTLVPIFPADTPITPLIDASPQPMATSLPVRIALEGVRYMDQHFGWNMCAPANLAMALSFWGWPGMAVDVARVVKPFDRDKNVMPYELVDYARNDAHLEAVLRYGGTIIRLKQLLAGGFPVLIEKGAMIRETISGQVTWMGHYSTLVGFDDDVQAFITRDSYYSPPDYPLDYTVSYSDFIQGWRAFDYTFIVVYKPEVADKLFAILGEYGDALHSDQIAIQIAQDEIQILGGLDRFFARYNLGSSLVRLNNFVDATAAYDQAYVYLNSLPHEQVPPKIGRMTWYQTGPYYAYFYTGRYQDVIDLATSSLNMTDEPFMEESYYWRGRSRASIGDNQEAAVDLCKSLVYHPGFEPTLTLMQTLNLPSCP